MRSKHEHHDRLHRWCLGSALLLSLGCPGGSSAPPIEAGSNPFEGRPLYMNPWSRARNQADQWRGSRPDEAKLMEQLGGQPVSLWFGDWNADVESDIRTDMRQARSQGALALMVLYNIPNRDCGQYAAGGVGDATAYREWIARAKRGIGKGPAAVILEPDALGQLSDCLDPSAQAERLELLTEAVERLSQGGQTAVYIDAGNSAWHPPELMAERLRGAGVARARGFALNVSSYMSTEATVAYGVAISEKLGGKPFILDTSRNGNGPTPDFQWCNPRNRAVGDPPLTPPSDPRVDAYVWVKVPGESDGECGGGPSAGDWWPEMAVELARNSTWVQGATGLPAPPPTAPTTQAPTTQAPEDAGSSVAPSPGSRR